LLCGLEFGLGLEQRYYSLEFGLHVQVFHDSYQW
jgi:hypothetical protein